MIRSMLKCLAGLVLGQSGVLLLAESPTTWQTAEGSTPVTRFAASSTREMS